MHRKLDELEPLAYGGFKCASAEQTSGASAGADAMIAISKMMGKGRDPPQAGEVAAAADSGAEATLGAAA